MKTHSIYTKATTLGPFLDPLPRLSSPGRVKAPREALGCATGEDPTLASHPSFDMRGRMF